MSTTIDRPDAPTRRPGRPSKFVESEFLQKACGLFWSQGYEGVSFDELVEKTGSTRRALYSLYQGKDEVFSRVIEFYQENTRNYLGQVLAAAGSPQLALTRMSEAVIEEATGKGARGCLILNATLSGTVPEKIRSYHAKAFEEISSLVRVRLRELGLPEMEAGRVGQTFMIHLQGVLALARAGVGPDVLQSACDNLIESLLKKTS